jgi:acyl-CoA synthetase (AMP-forming)/AMP-acid ligase II
MLRYSLRLLSEISKEWTEHPNIVLRGVFTAPADKVALIEEVPHAVGAGTGSSSDPPSGSISLIRRQVTYGQLRHLIGMTLKDLNREPLTQKLMALKKHDESGTGNCVILAEPGIAYAVGLLACWGAGLQATPLCHQHRLHTEMAHTLTDSDSSWCMFDEAVLEQVVQGGMVSNQPSDRNPQQLVESEFWGRYGTEPRLSVRIPLNEIVGELEAAQAAGEPLLSDGELPLPRPRAADDDALMIYTSGTTNKPKGVVHTHESVSNQVKILLDAWRWTATDKILNLLPLHHVHGLVNILCCALAAQATCVFAPLKGNNRWVCDRLVQGDLSLFMAVPAIYAKLIETWEALSAEERAKRRALSKSSFRLMVSGSAALPIPFIQSWRSLTGHTLLERYGMTEVGMALSQPYSPLEARIPGTVGMPLPTVDTAVVAEVEPQQPSAASNQEGQTSYDQVGQLLLSSPSVFHRYWRNPTATAKEFQVDPSDGKRWFKTGDTVGVRKAQVKDGESAVVSVNVFSILGRTSVDIIKSNGYKISALEIESTLLQEPTILTEVAVFGVPDATKGESIAAVFTLNPPNRSLSPEEAENKLRQLAKERLAPYKAPSLYFCFPDTIPKNAMGKVNKKELRNRILS